MCLEMLLSTCDCFFKALLSTVLFCLYFILATHVSLSRNTFLELHILKFNKCTMSPLNESCYISL